MRLRARYERSLHEFKSIVKKPLIDKKQKNQLRDYSVCSMAPVQRISGKKLSL